MTAPTQPPAPPAQTFPAPSQAINVRWLVSAIETLAFVAAMILQSLGYHTDAITTALGGAVAHGLLHN